MRLQLTILSCVLALTACSSGTTTVPLPRVWQVTAGIASHQEALHGLEFYPKTITINAGDTVTWVDPTKEPHSISFLAPGQTPPDPRSAQALDPAGGSTEDGTAYTSSGFLDPDKPYSLNFPKPGTYNYYCLVHQPQMVGTVIVNPPGTPYPVTQTQYIQQGQSAMAMDLGAAEASLALFPFVAGGPTVAAGIAPGLFAGPPANSTVLRFLSGNMLDSSSVTIPVGSSVTWVNESNNVPHTITFFPQGQPPPPDYPEFGPAAGGTIYGGTNTVNSGPISPGQRFTLTFTARGTYTYYCLIHDDKGMVATVIVQ